MIHVFVLFPVIDFAVAFFWIASVIAAWKGYTAPDLSKNPEERALGATVIIGQLNAVVTGSSIIVAGVGAFIAIGIDNITYPENFHLLYSVIWAMLAIGIALYGHSVLPSRTISQNFVCSPVVSIICATSLFFSLISGIRFVLALGSILWVLPDPSDLAG